MKVINILHLSDIHGGINDADIIVPKDKSIFRALSETQAFHTDMNKVFQRGLKKIVNDSIDKVDTIIVSGDIGNRGDTKTIDTGLKLISDIAQNLQVDKKNVLIVPGNHDLDRKNDTIRDSFKGFNKLCKKQKFSNTVKSFTPQHYQVRKLNIFGLNSCLGGNLGSNYLDKKQHRKFLKKIDKEIKKMKIFFLKDKKYNYQFDLDIPALGGNQIEEIITKLDELKTDIGVISLHHNPIPPKFQEIRPYSNLLDSGILLRKLSNSNKYIIILHGHTHTDMHYLTKIPSRAKNRSIATLGVAGFETLKDHQRVASIVSIFLDDKNNFLKAKVMPIIYEDLDFKEENFFTLIKDTPLPLTQFKYLLDVMEHDRFISYTEIIKSIPTDKLNEKEILELLLTYETEYFIASRRGNHNPKKWEFKRIK